MSWRTVDFFNHVVFNLLLIAFNCVILFLRQTLRITDCLGSQRLRHWTAPVGLYSRGLALKSTGYRLFSWKISVVHLGEVTPLPWLAVYILYIIVISSVKDG